jgi:hypothetical protein
MELKDIMSQCGIKCSEEKLAELSNFVQLKKIPKGSKTWAVVDGGEFGSKTPLQMRQCVESIRGCGNVDMKTWVEKLTAYEGFKTQQPVERIIAFYKKRMLDENLISG